MIKTDFLNEPPDSAVLTPYDREHMKLYLRLLDAATDGADWREAGAVEHVFTHFSLTLTVMIARVNADVPYCWMPIEAARSRSAGATVNAAK